ncbi:hypothetical protein Tco_1279265 [Tanacetum coccineum]
MQNTMAEQNVPTQAPARTDEQIVPRSQCLHLAVLELYEALDITPVDPAHPFELPPTGGTVIDFVIQLGYPEPVEFVSNIRTPSATNVDHAKLLWEEFTQGIQTFYSHKASHEASLKDPKKKAVPLLIPYGRDDYLLCNLKFISKALQANSNAIESLPPSHIPVADNDSLMEEIDLFLADDGSIPPGIESDDVDSVDDDTSISLPEFESFYVDYPNSGNSTIDVVEDIPVDVPNVLPTHPILEQDFIPTSEFFAYVVWIFLPFLAYPVIPPSLPGIESDDVDSVDDDTSISLPEFEWPHF